VSFSHHMTCAISRHCEWSCPKSGKTIFLSISMSSGQFQNYLPSSQIYPQSPYVHCSLQLHGGFTAWPDSSRKFPTTGGECIFVRTHTHHACLSNKQHLDAHSLLLQYPLFSISLIWARFWGSILVEGGFLNKLCWFTMRHCHLLVILANSDEK
jgi:hypothetical protein